MCSARLVLSGLVVTAIFVSGGCASVMSGRDAEVAINSTPSAAHVAVKNEKGQTVATGVTPAKISLKRGNGFFRKAPRYVATIEKPGYVPARVPINPKVNPWIAGNIVLGGVIGLAADSATGAMWKFSPTEINQQLVSGGDDLYSQTAADEVSQASHIVPEEQLHKEEESGLFKKSRRLPTLGELFTPGPKTGRIAARDSASTIVTE